MPPTKDKVLRQLSTVLLLRDKTTTPFSTTLSAATAVGATSITVPSSTNYAAGDTIRVGSGSNLETAVTSGAATGAGPYTINLVEPLSKAHAIGEAVVEQTAYDMGDISDAGATVSVTAQGTDVQVSTRRLAFTRLNGYASLGVDFTLPVVTIEGICFALGIPLSKVTGDGLASTTPKNVQTDGTEIASESNASLVLLGYTMDGTPVRFDLWSVDPDYTGFSVNLRRGNLAGVPCKFIASSGVAAQSASSYVANTSYRYGKGKVFDALTEAGLFAAAGSGVNTTVAAPSGGSNVAGQNALNLTSGAGATVGTWHKIDTGSTVEFHRVRSVAGNIITYDTPLYRTITTGVAVVEQKLVPFATVSPNGVTFGVNGNIDQIQEATTRLALGAKPGAARVTAGMAFIDYLLSSIALAVGIDSSQIASNRLLLANAIGTAQIDGVYVKGTLQDGTTAWFNFWGCAQDVSNAAIKMANSGIPEIPFSVLPTSGIQLMQHP